MADGLSADYADSVLEIREGVTTESTEGTEGTEGGRERTITITS